MRLKRNEIGAVASKGRRAIHRMIGIKMFTLPAGCAPQDSGPNLGKVG